MLFITNNNHALKRLSDYYVTRQVCHHTWSEKLESFVVFKMGNPFLLYLVEQFQLEFNSVAKMEMNWIDSVHMLNWNLVQMELEWNGFRILLSSMFKW